MKNIVCIICTLCAIAGIARAQKAKDVLEDGIVVGKNEKIFLKLSDKVLKYYLGITPTNPATIKGSPIFLVKTPSVNVYIKPLNPLNYASKTETKLILDPIKDEETKALASMADVFTKVMPQDGGAAAGEVAHGISPRLKGDKRGQKAEVPPVIKCDADALVKAYNAANEILKDDQKTAINARFGELKALDFATEGNTQSTIAAIDGNIDLIRKHFTKDVDKKIADLKTEIDKFPCPDAGYAFIVKQVFNGLVKDLTAVRDEQYKRVKNLDDAYQLVKKTADAAAEEKDGLKWCTFLDEVEASKDSISVYTITISDAGYKLSDAGEIVPMEAKEKIKDVIKVRRFQRFVPEVSAGIAYTNLSFPKFEPNTDEVTGKQYVTAAGEDVVKRINITAMINYNYFIPNSPVHPFIQLGIGANTDFPTLLLGGGFRFGGNTRIAIAAGVAASWIKTLDRLKVGDEVNGAADIEKDLKYQFALPKAYFGIQYNF